MPVRRRKRAISDYMSTRTNACVTCAAVESARKIGNQWRLIVIRYLLERSMRFNELLMVACEIDLKRLSLASPQVSCLGVARSERSSLYAILHRPIRVD